MSDESPTSANGPRQIVIPRRLTLVNFITDGTDNAQVAIFRVKIIDPRLRVRCTLIGVPNNRRTTQAAFLAGRGLTIWPYGVEGDQQRGATGVPVVDVIPGVTLAAPQAFPIHAGLGGWSREFSSIADAVECRIAIPAQGEGSSSGKLVLQTKYMPQVHQVIPWQQWDEIRSLCEPELIQGPVES